jgi:DNA-binding transcriptional regulator YiaG
METPEKLAQLYAAGYARGDVARLTGRRAETVALWEEGLASAPDEEARSLLLRIMPGEFGAFLEQQKAIDELAGKGLNRTEIARLVGVTSNSLRMWDRAEKLARGRTRELLLSYSRMPRGELPNTVFGRCARRGRLSEEESRRRMMTMKEVGLWPPIERARKLQFLLEVAARKDITATELITLLGASRRSFYSYLSLNNSSLMPVEMVRRYGNLSSLLGIGGNGGSGWSSIALTLEERFAQASLILFEEYHYTGFDARDPVKDYALKTLAQATGFHERTLRRYLPLRADPQRRAPRVMIETLEATARKFGSLVRLA